MASLLVYVDAERLVEVLGGARGEPGRKIQLSRATLPAGVDHLDETGSLFLVTLDRGRAIIVATVEQPQLGDIVGEATIHEHDISDLLVRLGCEKVWRVPEWASVPRSIPPNDVDLLRYVLGLELAVGGGEARSIDEASTERRKAPAEWVAPTRDAPRREHAPVRSRLARAKTDPPENAPAGLPRTDAGSPASAAITVQLPARPAAAFATAQRRTDKGTPAPAPSPTLANVRPPRAKTDPPNTPLGPLATDAAADKLREAVFDHPAADAPRIAYAERLVKLGDPRGELVLLQLERVQTGGPISQRERFLVEKIGDACLGTLRPYLHSYELARGFLHAAVVAPNVAIPDHIHRDRTWTTLQDLATRDLRLMMNPRVTARRLRIASADLGKLAVVDELLPFETLLPYRDPTAPAWTTERRAHGLEPRSLDSKQWAALLDGGALMRVRAISIDGRSLGDRLGQLLDSRFGRRLAHLDAAIEAAGALVWRHQFDWAQIPLMTLRFAIRGVDVLVGFERTDRAPRLIVETPDFGPETAEELVRLLDSLRTGIEEAELNAQAQQLLAPMLPRFQRLVVSRRPSRALA